MLLKDMISDQLWTEIVRNIMYIMYFLCFNVCCLLWNFSLSVFLLNYNLHTRLPDTCRNSHIASQLSLIYNRSVTFCNLCFIHVVSLLTFSFPYIYRVWLTIILFNAVEVLIVHMAHYKLSFIIIIIIIIIIMTVVRFSLFAVTHMIWPDCRRPGHDVELHPHWVMSRPSDRQRCFFHVSRQRRGNLPPYSKSDFICDRR